MLQPNITIILSTNKQTAVSKVINRKDADPKTVPYGLLYAMPEITARDIDPSGEYIVGGGKLATVIPCFHSQRC
jgi:hypothetical protein